MYIYSRVQLFRNIDNSEFKQIVSSLENNMGKNLKEQIECTPPDYVLPNTKEHPLLPLHPSNKEANVSRLHVFFMRILLSFCTLISSFWM